MSEEEEILQLKQSMLKVLTDAKENIYKKFDEFDFDPSCFNININLKVTIDDSILQIKEGWKSVLHPVE